MLRRLLVLVVVALTTVIVSDASAHAACRCKDLSLPQQVNNAGAVFSGTLTMASGPTTSGDRQTMSYDVKVDRVYKGDIKSPRVTVKSDASEAACGLTGMTADTRYLFFVRVSDADLFANSCGGTGPGEERAHAEDRGPARPGVDAEPTDARGGDVHARRRRGARHAHPAGRTRRRDGARRPARPDGVRCPGPLTRRQDLEVLGRRRLVAG